MLKRISKMSCKENQLEQLLDTVLRSSRHRNVYDELIKNIGANELSKGKTLKEAIKSTKNKLHQIGGAYFCNKPKYSRWLGELRKAASSKDRGSFLNVCMKVMSFYSSTKERLKIMDEFYAKIFSLLPPVGSIIDIACGFNPLAIPWMSTSGNLTYYAYDIYKDMIDFLNDFMAIANIRGYAEIRDVLHNPPDISADLAFILKTIPCFDQIDRSASSKLLDSIKANWIVVSFPIKSLGGRERKMAKNYTARFNQLIYEKSWSIKRLEFKTELAFLIGK